MPAKKSTLYKQLFFTYFLVIVCLIGGFNLYLINYVRSESKSNRISSGEQLSYNVHEVLNEIESSNKVIINKMYYDYMLNKDIIYFLDSDINTYLKNKLDYFSNTDQFTYNGIENFILSSFVLNDKIENIIFLSKDRGEARSFNDFNQISIEQIDDYEKVVKSLPNVLFSDNMLYSVNLINNPDTLQEEGRLIIVYDLSEINALVSKYGINYEIFLLEKTTNSLYSSQNIVTSLNAQDLEIIKNINEQIEPYEFSKYNFLNMNFSNDLNIITMISMKNLVASPEIFYTSILLVDLALILISTLILNFKLEKLVKRTDNILEVMEQVKEGNLKVQIPADGVDDEISYISQHFNQMCIELDRYINKSYLAEINQKKAEMIALQNQINPHFLYNTLECIRMKAICNGDKDVGKMLYNLSYLFRKQVKDNHMITLQSELEYCIQYMEIFKFRYQDKFDFYIDCPEEFFNNEMIKFTIQPLVENYFIHGIKLEKSNNFIKIKVLKEQDNLKILIDDNGKGIPQEKLVQINEDLKRGLNEKSANQSIGIMNAHARIVGTYGDEYGIYLDNNSIGARIIILIPVRGGQVDEKGHAS